MSRGLRLIPIVLLLWLVAGLAWRLVKPGDTAVPSQMVERTVPQFALAPGVGGKPGFAAADLATGQPRLLNVFASWCVPCVTEVRVLGELKRRGVRIDGIAVRDTPEALTAFLARNGDPYERIGADPQSETQIAFGSSGVPETFVIEGKGVIRYQQIGAIDAADVPMILSRFEQAR